MELESVLVPLATFIGAIATTYVTVKTFQSKKQKDREELEIAKSEMLSDAHKDNLAFATQLRNELRAELDVVKDELKKVKEERAKLKETLIAFEARAEIREQQLLMKIAIMESAHNDLPIPQWLKDEKGNILSVNWAYERVFLKPRGYTKAEYKRDEDCWPEDTVEEFRVNDKLVESTDQAWIGNELVPDENGEKIEWLILKYPRKSGNMFIGISGIAFPKSMEQLKRAIEKI